MKRVYGPRTREKSIIPPVHEYYYIDYSKGGTDTQSGPYLTSYELASMSDVVTKNFRKKRKNGETIINPMTYLHTSKTSSGIGQTAYSNWNSSGVVTVAFTGSGPLTTVVCQSYGLGDLPVKVSAVEGRRQAVLNALKNIDKTPYAVGEDVLELSKSVKLLYAPLKKIVREIDRTKMSSIVDMSASAWLTYRMGFAPLVRSLHDVLESVSMQGNRAPRRNIRVSHGRSAYDESLSENEKIPHGTGDWSVFRSTRIEGSYHATVRYEVKDPNYDWKWKYGLRNKDLPAAFWAKMPLSFMIDRFVDVSSMITACANLGDPSIKILGCSVTHRHSIKTRKQVTGVTSTVPRTSYSASGEVVEETKFNMSRSGFKPSVGDVVPVVKPAGLVNNIEKVADLLSLIRVFAKGRF